MEFNLVVLCVKDLGFPEGAITREIIGADRDRDLFGNSAPFTGGRYNQHGLGLCQAEVGPQLRLKFDNQPLNERIYVAMKPITASDGEPRIFLLAHTADGLSLDAARARPDDQWTADDKFVFCLPE